MEPIQILWLNRSFTPSGAGVKSHTHSYYHLFIVSNGRLVFTAGDQTLSIEKGTAILVPKGMRHSYLNAEAETVEGIEIKFTIQDPSTDAKLSKAKEAPLSHDEAISLLGERVMSEYTKYGIAADDFAKTLLHAMLKLFLSASPDAVPQRISFFDLDGSSDLTKNVVRYLESHYRESFSLEALAEALSFNKSYLCTAFKKDTKITITDCLNLIRIRHAAELISYSESSMADVAKEAGFGSASHFNHVFRQYIGTTPSEVRKAYPNHILVESDRTNEKKEFHPNRMLYNVLAGKMITPEAVALREDL